MLKVRYSAKFKKDFKAIVRRGYNIELFEEVLILLREEKNCPKKDTEMPTYGIRNEFPAPPRSGCTTPSAEAVCRYRYCPT